MQFEILKVSFNSSRSKQECLITIPDSSEERKFPQTLSFVWTAFFGWSCKSMIDTLSFPKGHSSESGPDS